MMFTTTPATRFVRAGATGAPQAASAGDIRDGTTVRVLMNTQQRKVYEVEIRE